jgi:hypothetical protein
MDSATPSTAPVRFSSEVWIAFKLTAMLLRSSVLRSVLGSDSEVLIGWIVEGGDFKNYWNWCPVQSGRRKRDGWREICEGGGSLVEVPDELPCDGL